MALCCAATIHSLVGCFFTSFAARHRVLVSVPLIFIAMGHWVSGIWFTNVSFIPMFIRLPGVSTFRGHGGSWDIMMVLYCLGSLGISIPQFSALL